MDSRRRRILIGASVGLLLAGLGVAAAYALSTHTKQAAQHEMTSLTTKHHGTGHTVSTKQTSTRTTTTHHTTTTSGQGHHDGNETTTTKSGGHSSTTSTVTTKSATTGSHHGESTKPVTISDAFAAGIIDPTTWSKVAYGGDVSPLEQGGQLELLVGANAVPGGPQNRIDVHVATRCAFPGNFDARVSYTFPPAEWPAGDNIDVGMNTNAGDAAVMRDNSSQSGDGYVSWVGSSNPASVPFSSNGGSLRIARVDDIETTYYWHGGRWWKLATSRDIGQAVIGLQAVSDGQGPFGGQELKVAFDNFKVTGAKPVCS